MQTFVGRHSQEAVELTAVGRRESITGAATEPTGTRSTESTGARSTDLLRLPRQILRHPLHVRLRLPRQILRPAPRPRFASRAEARSAAKPASARRSPGAAAHAATAKSAWAMPSTAPETTATSHAATAMEPATSHAAAAMEPATAAAPSHRSPADTTSSSP